MEWKEVRLGDIVSIKSGLAYKGAFIGKGENILLGMGCVSFKDKFLFSGARPYEADCDDKYCVEPGDIVLATRQQSDKLPILAMPAIIPSSLKAKKIIYGTNLYKVENHSEVTNDFLFWQLKTPDYIDYISSVKTGSVVRMVTKKNVEDYVFRCPPKEVRDRISTLLWGLDRKIELNNKINADLEEMAQAIFKNWFVDFEPFKDGKFVDSELGMIPEGWEVGSLGDFCNVFTGKKNTNQAIEKGLYPFFSCAPEPLASNDAIFNGKAIIIAGNGSYTGRTSFYNGGFDLYQRTYACTIREQDKENLMIFFYHMMKQFFEPVKMGGTRGSSIPYIVMGDITQQKFPYSEEWLIRFSNIVNSMMDRKLRIDKENSRLSLLRDTLLPRLMSGELEVPE